MKYIPDYVAIVVRGEVNVDQMPEKWNEDD